MVYRNVLWFAQASEVLSINPMQAILHATATSDAMEMAVAFARRLQVAPHASDDFERRLPSVAGMRAAI